MTNEQRERDNVTRRGVLMGSAAFAGAAATAGTAGAYRDLTDVRPPATQNDRGEGRTLSLLGIVGGWVGVAPAELDGVSNPTLRLIEGEEHEIVWTNGDGSRHNFVLADEDGDVIDATDYVEEQGESTSFMVTPDEEMAQYYCEPHPVQMRGPVELVDAGAVHELRVQVEDEQGSPLGAEVFVGDRHSFSAVAARPSPDGDDEGDDTDELEPEGGNGDATEEADDVEDDEEADVEDDEEADVEDEETPAEEDAPSIARFDLLEDGEYTVEVWTYGHERVTEQVTVDGDDAELSVTLPAIEVEEPTDTFQLALEEGRWVGVAPEEIADEENPTLHLEAGESYAIEWQNTIGRLEDQKRWGEPLPGHNLAIASGGETNEWNTYVRSNFTDEAGETQTVEFVAEDDMAIYLDQSQLEAVGEVVVE